MIETTTVKTSNTLAPSKTITIRPASLQPNLNKNQQQIIVIPQSMLVNGCISAKDLKSIIDDTKPSIKSMENRTNLKRPSSSGDSTYGTDSEEGSSIHEGSDSKPVRKRANLDHLSPEEKLMRRKLKNRVAAQNARDKKRVKMEDMEKLINQMKEERRKLVEENSRLQEFNSQLQLDNASLQEENTELKQRLGINPVNPQLTLELPLSPLSTPPASPASPAALSPSTTVTS